MINVLLVIAALIAGMITGARLMGDKYEQVILDAAETTKMGNEIVKLYKEDQEDSMEQFEHFINIMINENIMLRKMLKKAEIGGDKQ